MEDNVTGEQSDLGPYCLQYISYTRALADDKWLNNGSFEEKKPNYANCITVFLIYVCFVKQMCKLSTN